MRIIASVLALALLTGCTSDEPSVETEQAGPAATSPTPDPAADEVEDEVEVDHEALVIDGDQLHGRPLVDTVDPLNRIAAEAALLTPGDLDGESRYRWGASYLDFLDEEEPYSSAYSPDPAFLAWASDGPAYAARRERAAAEDDFVPEEWTEDHVGLFSTRVYEDPTPGATSVEGESEAHDLLSSVYVELSLFVDHDAARAHLDWYADSPTRLDDSYYVDVAFGAVTPLDDPRVAAETTATSLMAQTEDVAETITLPDGLRLVRRDLVVGSAVIAIEMVGQQDAPLEELTAEAAGLLVDALVTDGPPVRTIAPARLAGDAEAQLAHGLTERIRVVAGLPPGGVDGERFYSFAISGVDEDRPVFSRGGPDVVLFEGGTELEDGILAPGVQPGVVTGAAVDGRIYETVEGDNPLHGRVSLYLVTYEDLERTDTVYHAVVARAARATDRLAPIDDDRIDEQYVGFGEPDLPGPSDDPDVPAPGLESIDVTLRIGNLLVRLEVTGTAGVAALRELTVELVGEVLDAYEVD